MCLILFVVTKNCVEKYIEGDCDHPGEQHEQKFFDTRMRLFHEDMMNIKSVCCNECCEERWVKRQHSNYKWEGNCVCARCYRDLKDGIMPAFSHRNNMVSLYFIVYLMDSNMFSKVSTACLCYRKMIARCMEI